jgi:hypothetical protein
MQELLPLGPPAIAGGGLERPTLKPLPTENKLPKYACGVVARLQSLSLPPGTGDCLLDSDLDPFLPRPRAIKAARTPCCVSKKSCVRRSRFGLSRRMRKNGLRPHHSNQTWRFLCPPTAKLESVSGRFESTHQSASSPGLSRRPRPSSSEPSNRGGRDKPGDDAWKGGST